MPQICIFEQNIRFRRGFGLSFDRIYHGIYYSMSKNYRKTPEKSESTAEFIFIQIDISKRAFVVPSKHTKDCPRHAAKYPTVCGANADRAARSADCRFGCLRLSYELPIRQCRPYTAPRNGRICSTPPLLPPTPTAPSCLRRPRRSRCRICKMRSRR